MCVFTCRTRIAAVLSAAAIALLACGGGGGTTGGGTKAAILSDYSAEKGTPGGQLVFSDWEPVEDLNIIASSAATTQQVAQGSIWSTLWAFDGKNKPYPDLVADVPSTDNGLVKKIDDAHMDVTIKLKKGLKWSDGSPLTANDVKFTVDAICDPDTGASSQDGFDHIASQEVKDAQTLIWHFGPNKKGTCGLSQDLTNGIYPYLLMGNTPMAPMPQSVLGSTKHADWARSAYFTKKPTVTSGPYMVQDFTPGPAAQVVLVKNPHYLDGRDGAKYFGHAPYLDKLIYKIYGDKSSQIAGLQNGDTDLGLDLIAADLPGLRAISKNNTQTAIGLLDEFLTFNLGNNTIGCEAQQFAGTCGKATVFKDDPKLRQALDLSIDKDTINRQLVQGIGKPMNGLFVSSLEPYFDKSIPPFQRDVAKAKSLLDADGWTVGSDGVRTKGGRKLEFVLSTTSGNPQRAAEEEQIIASWKEVGASVTTKNSPAGKFFDSFKNGGINATGQYDVALYANNWSPDPNAWCSTYVSTQIPSPTNPSGNNWGRGSDPTLDDLCKSGNQEVDLTKRVDIYKKVQAEARQFMPVSTLYERPDVFSLSTFFGNFVPTVNTCLATCNAADWYHKGKS